MGLKKRGLSNTSISIIIILVVLVAAILVYNFVIKKEKIAEPDPIIFQCASACDSGQQVAFCNVERAFVGGGLATCNQLATNPQYAQYGVQTCPAISCTVTPQESDKTCVTGLNATWVNPTSDGSCPAQEGKFARKRTPSDSPPTAGQICCFYYN